MGNPLPPRIANAPELSEGLEFYFEAFFELDSERHHGEGLMPIGWWSIVRYGQYYGLNSEEIEDLVYLIRRMDDAHLGRIGEQRMSKIKNRK